ncbi:MAG: M48 family metallopeptidase [Proteobacteria bacterium]|nr:M48 family metallopeptidase [Pseudomonadota bacterium]
MPVFTIVFATMLLLSTSIKIYLDKRQIRHVSQNRSFIPSAFTGKIDPESHQKAADYTIAKTRLSLWHHLYDAVILALLTFGGGLLWIDHSIHQLGHGLITDAAFVMSVFLVLAVLDLPFNTYRIFAIENKFGFNHMKPGLFIRDLLIQGFITLVLGLPLVLIILWIMGRYQQTWWMTAWLTFIAFNLIVLAVYPIVIAPLFNRFKPLNDETLKTEIQALLERCQFKVNGLFIMDGSTRSSHGNAYFTGLGQSRRIVFFDTLINQLEPDEIIAVLAHELGHYKLHHVKKRIGLIFTISFFGFWLLANLMAHTWFFSGLGLSTPGNAEALVLFLLAGPIFFFPLTPIGSWYSRLHEYEADTYAIHQASGKKLVDSLVKLFRENASTLTPDPLYSLFYDSHPGAQARINHILTTDTTK